MKNFGYIKSELDGTEFVFGAPSMNNIPEIFTYRDVMPNILDQGNESICVPCSISGFLNWRENLDNGSKSDNGVDYHGIYDKRTNEGEGMSFKEAFHILKHEGVDSGKGMLNVYRYALVNNVLDLKKAIVANGPCVGALPVYNYSREFWNNNNGYFQGGHAICIVGYDKDGFIIRNSWGTRFADKGYTRIKYKDFTNFYELWTIE